MKWFGNLKLQFSLKQNNNNWKKKCSLRRDETRKSEFGIQMLQDAFATTMKNLHVKGTSIFPPVSFLHVVCPARLWDITGSHTAAELLTLFLLIHSPVWNFLQDYKKQIVPLRCISYLLGISQIVSSINNTPFAFNSTQVYFGTCFIISSHYALFL